MANIVVTCPMVLTDEQKARLEAVGEVTYFDTHPENPEEWLKRAEGHDIVCSWMFGLREKYSELKNIYVSVPFVGVSSFADLKVLKDNHLTISNSPGSNSHSVSEWIVYMILKSMRQLDRYVNTTDKVGIPLPVPSVGLKGKNITILGKGNVGIKVGKICEAMEMNVTYFDRGDNLSDKVSNALVVVDTLSANETTKGILNKEFFDNLKTGAIFISVTVDSIVDIEAMLNGLDSGKLSYVAHDVMNARPGDSADPLYTKLINHKNVMATPHIAAFTDVTNTIGNDMMIANVEAWANGKPINVVR